MDPFSYDAFDANATILTENCLGFATPVIEKSKSADDLRVFSGSRHEHILS
jgi:hypothetical protein